MRENTYLKKRKMTLVLTGKKAILNQKKSAASPSAEVPR